MKKILFAILLLSMNSFLSCNSASTGDPKATLISFFEALSKNDMETAKKLITKDSEEMFSFIEMGMKEKGLQKEIAKFKKENLEMGEPKIDGDKATVSVKEKTTGESLNYILKKENGTWKVAFDMVSLMSMGMEKMNEKGISVDSVDNMMEKLKNINVDSLKDQMKEGMDKLDSAKKELEKIK